MEIRPNRLRYCLDNNIPTISTRIESPWAYMTELAAASGYFDFIEYEGEYAPHTEEDLEDVCRAAELYDCATVVKIDRQNREFMAQKAIACGAQGILFADLYTAEEVRQTLEAIKSSYPGGGIMGRANRRHCMNGSGRMLHSEYRKQTDATVNMIMIEKEDAVKNLEEICQVPGVDMVVYGPFDYALNMGWEMGPQAKELADIHRYIIETSLKYGVRPLILVDNTSQIQYYYDLGARDFSLGDEMQMHIDFYNREAPVVQNIMGRKKRVIKKTEIEE